MRPFHWVLLGFVSFAGCSNAPRTAVKLTILGLAPEAARQLRVDAVDEFTRRTGVEVEMIPTPGTSAEQTALVLKLLERGAKSPDLYLVDVIWPGTLHKHLLDLTPFLTEETRRHMPALLDNGTVQNRVVSLPFYVNTGLLYYRTDLLKKYGFADPPRTWEELARVARRIQTAERQRGNRDFWGYVWQGNAYEGLTCNALEWQIAYGGGHIIENDGSITVSNPRTIQAMKTAATWVGTISPNTVLSYTESDALTMFNAGKAAFMRHWSSAYRSVVRDSGTSFAGVTLLPAGPAGRAHTIGGFHWAVSKYSEHPRQAADLVIYLTGQEVQTRRALARGYVPTYPELYQRPDLVRALPQTVVLREADNTSWTPRPSTITGDKYAVVSKAYYQSVHQILSNNIAAEVALPELARKLAEITGFRESAPDGRKHVQ